MSSSQVNRVTTYRQSITTDAETGHTINPDEILNERGGNEACELTIQIGGNDGSRSMENFLQSNNVVTRCVEVTSSEERSNEALVTHLSSKFSNVSHEDVAKSTKYANVGSRELSSSASSSVSQRNLADLMRESLGSGTYKAVKETGELKAAQRDDVNVLRTTCYDSVSSSSQSHNPQNSFSGTNSNASNQSDATGDVLSKSTSIYHLVRSGDNTASPSGPVITSTHRNVVTTRLKESPTMDQIAETEKTYERSTRPNSALGNHFNAVEATWIVRKGNSIDERTNSPLRRPRVSPTPIIENTMSRNGAWSSFDESGKVRKVGSVDSTVWRSKQEDSLKSNIVADQRPEIIDEVRATFARQGSKSEYVTLPQQQLVADASAFQQAEEVPETIGSIDQKFWPQVTTKSDSIADHRKNVMDEVHAEFIRQGSRQEFVTLPEQQHVDASSLEPAEDVPAVIGAIDSNFWPKVTEGRAASGQPVCKQVGTIDAECWLRCSSAVHDGDTKRRDSIRVGNVLVCQNVHLLEKRNESRQNVNSQREAEQSVTSQREAEQSVTSQREAGQSVTKQRADSRSAVVDSQLEGISSRSAVVHSESRGIESQSEGIDCSSPDVSSRSIVADSRSGVAESRSEGRPPEAVSNPVAEAGNRSENVDSQSSADVIVPQVRGAANFSWRASTKRTIGSVNKNFWESQSHSEAKFQPTSPACYEKLTPTSPGQVTAVQQKLFLRKQEPITRNERKVGAVDRSYWERTSRQQDKVADKVTSKSQRSQLCEISTSTPEAKEEVLTSTPQAMKMHTSTSENMEVHTRAPQAVKMHTSTTEDMEVHTRTPQAVKMHTSTTEDMEVQIQVPITTPETRGVQATAVVTSGIQIATLETSGIQATTGETGGVPTTTSETSGVLMHVPRRSDAGPEQRCEDGPAKLVMTKRASGEFRRQSMPQKKVGLVDVSRWGTSVRKSVGQNDGGGSCQ